VSLPAPESLLCVSYHDPYLPASTVLRSLQARAGGRGGCSWRDLTASLPAAACRGSAARSPSVRTRCCLRDLGWKPFSG